MTSEKRCPVCRSTAVRVELPSEYADDHCGLSHVILTGKGVKITHCANCGHETTLVEDEQQLLQVLGLGLLLGPPGMRGEELRYLRTLYGDDATGPGASARTVPPRDRGRFGKPGIGSSGAQARRQPSWMALINLFRDSVIASEYCFLADEHRRLYSEPRTRPLSTDIQEMLAAQPNVGSFRVRRRPRKRLWSAEVVAA